MLCNVRGPYIRWQQLTKQSLGAFRWIQFLAAIDKATIIIIIIIVIATATVVIATITTITIVTCLALDTLKTF